MKHLRGADQEHTWRTQPAACGRREQRPDDGPAPGEHWCGSVEEVLDIVLRRPELDRSNEELGSIDRFGDHVPFGFVAAPPSRRGAESRHSSEDRRIRTLCCVIYVGSLERGLG